MEGKEKAVCKKVEELKNDGVVKLLDRWGMEDFVELAIEKKLDGRKLLDVTEGIVKLWRPKENSTKFIAFIDDLKLNPEKYLVHQNNQPTDDTDCEDNKTTTVDIESQYQTVTVRKKDEHINTAPVNATMNAVEEIIRRLVPSKSFLYRNQQKVEKSPSYLPMDTTPTKTRKLFRLSSYEYPFFDIRARFSRQETTNDRGYYSMKRNSRYYIHRSYKNPESRTKYKSLSTPQELTEKYPEDHFYEDLCYNEVERVTEIEGTVEKEIENRVATVKPYKVKFQELFQSFKVPFFKKPEMVEDKVEKELEVRKESEKDVHIYENSDSMVNMYDSVRVNRDSRENSVEQNRTKLPVEDYLDPVQLNKDYCDVTYPQRQKDDSLLGFIMSIFENRFGMRRETNDTTNSDESETDSHKADHTLHNIDATTNVWKWPDIKPGRSNMADRPLPVPVENEPYYMNIDREEAENLLTGQPDGTFVLRPSSQPNHAYTLTISCSEAVHHVGVRRRPDGRLALGFARRGERSFTSVTSLLRHHRKRRLLLVAAGGVIGGTTLNETPHYYQCPSSIPVVI